MKNIYATEDKWPKKLPPLSAEQQRISDEFVRQWHEHLPQKYGIVENFNHRFPVDCAPPNFVRTLEIGAGLGEHLRYEQLTTEQKGNYYALELRENMAAKIREDFPEVKTIVGDAQTHIDFEEGFFDRILAIHVLEHLPNLPACIEELYRLCDKDRGSLAVVIPCEGGLAYSFARKISAEALYRKRFGGSYKWFYTREHINMPGEIIEELEKHFVVRSKKFFPLPLVPLITVNLCIGLILSPRPASKK